jgi:hypothetical protein
MGVIMATYLDNAGVTQILTKIKSLLAKKAEITAIPTKVSQLTNDSQYQNATEVDTKIGTELGKLDYDGPINSNDQEEPTFYISNVTQKDGKISATRNRFLYAWDRAYLKSIESNMAISSHGVDQKISEAVGKITSFEYKVVDSLPSTSEGKKGVVYLVAHSGSTTNNVYDEYIFLPADGSTAARYEKIGTTDIDLTPYAKKTEIPTKVSDITNDIGFITAQTSASHIVNAINKLDYSDTAEEGKYVSSVSETDGVITVTRASLPAVGTADSPISNATIESIFTQVFG